MTSEQKFINLVTKLTEDFNVHKRHCFKFGSKQLTDKLMRSLEGTINKITRSIEYVKEFSKRDQSECCTRMLEELVEEVMEDEKFLCKSHFLKFLQYQYRELQILFRGYAREKQRDAEKLDRKIGQFPEYALKTPEFPQHLTLLGILDDEEFSSRDKTVSECVEDYKKKIQKLVDDKRHFEAVEKTRLETFITVQELSLIEIRKTQAFLRENSIDHISTVRDLGKFCKKGYLDSLD